MMDRSDNISTYLENQQIGYFYAIALPYILDMEAKEKQLNESVMTDEEDSFANIFRSRIEKENASLDKETLEFIKSIDDQIVKSLEEYKLYELHKEVKAI